MEFPEFSSYAEEKEYSARLDAELGFRIPEVEARLLDPKDGSRRWISQGPGVFLTPYSELYRMLLTLEPVAGDLVVDLGAGYGRLGIVLKEFFAGVGFLGYELVPERVEEGNRVLAARGTGRIVEANLSLHEPAPAPFYFLYDYGSRPAVAKTLGDLRAIARDRKITVVGRGREVRDQVEREQPWLTVVEPEHHGNFSLYSSR